jgi:hypothetical protein
MAVSKIRRVYDEYVCLSGDVKPTTGVGMGTMLTEYDTGARFMFINGAWEEDLTIIYAVKQAMGV